MAKFFSDRYWANFHICKWPNSSQIIIGQIFTFVNGQILLRSCALRRSTTIAHPSSATSATTRSSPWTSPSPSPKKVNLIASISVFFLCLNFVLSDRSLPFYLSLGIKPEVAPKISVLLGAVGWTYRQPF